MKKHLFIALLFTLLSCKEREAKNSFKKEKNKVVTIEDATGFKIEKKSNGVTIITVTSPWPQAKNGFTYALVPKHKKASISIPKNQYDAIIATPVYNIIATSTAHIPALESLGVDSTLIGFPNTDYISSTKTRKRIDNQKVKELGNQELLNTEIALSLNPEVVFGFGIDRKNKAYQTLKAANIPIVYNGDWAEKTPLGKAEWIKFFAPFFNQEKKADSIFKSVKKEYLKAKKLALKATKFPTVISGAMYKDVWYLPGGKSWAAQYLKDAKVAYLYKDNTDAGSLSLSWEAVLEKGKYADFWISPSQFTSYKELQESSKHYTEFNAFKNKKIYSFAGTKGATGGLLFFELAPSRPDIVLKDLISIFHPEVLPNYKPFFYQPLK